MAVQFVPAAYDVRTPANSVVVQLLLQQLETKTAGTELPRQLGCGQ